MGFGELREPMQERSWADSGSQWNTRFPKGEVFRGHTAAEPTLFLSSQFSACADTGENLQDLLRSLILPIFWAVFVKGEVSRDVTGFWCEGFRETSVILHRKGALWGLW